MKNLTGPDSGIGILSFFSFFYPWQANGDTLVQVQNFHFFRFQYTSCKCTLFCNSEKKILTRKPNADILSTDYFNAKKALNAKYCFMQ